MSDIIIIGRGLAGATLSFELIRRKIPHKIVDEPTLSASSKVAAGLINPIVLKRLKMVKGAELFTSGLASFYTVLEQLTGFDFFTPVTIEHIFQSVGEVNLWEEKKDQAFHSTYLKRHISNPYPSVKAPLGLGVMENAAWINTVQYLNAHEHYCQNNGVEISSQHIKQHDIDQYLVKGHEVILCTGHLFKDSGLLPAEIFSPTHGEVMTIRTSGLPEHTILHSSIFSLPIGNNLFKIGATYQWDNLTDQVTEVGLQKLKADLGKIYNGDYTIVEHRAGVRPNTKDRQPIIGKISKNLYTFNGMGSRAALMTPFLSSVFADFLTKSSPIPEHYNINRFL